VGIKSWGSEAIAEKYRDFIFDHPCDLYRLNGITSELPAGSVIGKDSKGNKSLVRRGL
jgi:hypothetical protein